MKKIHYGWLITAVATIVMFCALGFTVTCMPVYVPYLRDAFDLSPVDASRLITVRNIATLISLLTVNRLVRRIELRNTLLLGMMCTAAMFAICALAKSYFALLVGMTFGGMAHCYGGMVPVSGLLTRWFNTNKGMALGIASAGSGASSIFMPTVITLVIENADLRTAFLMVTAFVLICTAIVFLVIRNYPKDIGLTPVNKVEDKKKKESVSAQPKRPQYAGDKVTERTFLVWTLILGISIYGLWQHWALLYNEFDFDPVFISLLLGFGGLMMTIGKLVYGFITDCIGARKAGWMFISMLAIGGMLASLSGFQSIALAWIATFFVSFGLPVGTLGLSLFASDLYSQTDYLRVVQYFNISYKIGSIFGTELTGYVTQITGSYVPAYIVHTVLMVVALLICIGAYLRIMKRATAPEVLIDEEESWRVAQ